MFCWVHVEKIFFVKFCNITLWPILIQRMYEALGVRDIDMILPPPQQPQPEDPGMENSKALQMMKLQAFQGQNHAAHINAHQAFMSSFLVANNPPTMGILCFCESSLAADIKSSSKFLPVLVISI